MESAVAIFEYVLNLIVFIQILREIFNTVGILRGAELRHRDRERTKCGKSIGLCLLVIKCNKEWESSQYATLSKINDGY